MDVGEVAQRVLEAGEPHERRGVRHLGQAAFDEGRVAVGVLDKYEAER
jgi:hypothetical protein